MRVFVIHRVNIVLCAIIKNMEKDFTRISDLLKNFDIKKAEKPLYPRQELIKKFVDKLNSDRICGGYKPLPASFYAIKMYDAGLKSDYLLWWFWGYCNDAKSFSSCWWWSLKPQ
jgi:hypothetical protein